MKHVSIQQALQHVANNPEPNTDELLTLPAHELIARTLFEIANTPSSKSPGSLARANTARNLIFTRLVGRRKPGSHPALRKKSAIKFVNLTGELEK